MPSNVNQSNPPGRKSKKPQAEEGSTAWRIRKARKRKGWSQQKLADEVGITNPAVSQIETGGGIDDGTLRKMAVALEDHFEVDWLKDYFRNRDAKEIKARLGATKASAGMRELPYVGCIAAGKLTETYPQKETISIPEWMIPKGVECAALCVKGDSMEGAGVYEGDLVVVAQHHEPHNGDMVVVETEKGANIKRWSKDGDTVTLIPESHDPKHEKIVLQTSEIKKVYKVVGILRKFK